MPASSVETAAHIHLRSEMDAANQEYILASVSIARADHGERIANRLTKYKEGKKSQRTAIRRWITARTQEKRIER